MTIGIYILKFNNTDKVYVGQSVNIEKRFKEHYYAMLNNKVHSEKLNSAYKEYGLPPLVVEHTCIASDLDSLEELSIIKYNAVTNGFNTWDKALRISRGEQHPNASHSNAVIAKVLFLMIEYPLKSLTVISNTTGISKAIIQNISCLVAHVWLKDEYPEQYNELERIYLNKERIGPGNTLESKGYTDTKLVSPEGVEYLVTNASKFAKEHSLNRSHVLSVLKGLRNTHKGWKRAGDIS